MCDFGASVSSSKEQTICADVRCIHGGAEYLWTPELYVTDLSEEIYQIPTPCVVFQNLSRFGLRFVSQVVKRKVFSKGSYLECAKPTINTFSSSAVLREYLLENAVPIRCTRL
jgi:hypothetical protein